jgi:hypothetical protein
MALRTVKNSAESKNKPVFLHFQKPSPDDAKPDHINVNINDIMENMGLPQFTYDSFTAAYEADPQIQELVDNFNSQGISMNSDDAEEEPEQGNDDAGDTVSQMAKSATDIGDSPLG